VTIVRRYLSGSLDLLPSQATDLSITNLFFEQTEPYLQNLRPARLGGGQLVPSWRGKGSRRPIKSGEGDGKLHGIVMCVSA
jgi:hypothetical protein